MTTQIVQPGIFCCVGTHITSMKSLIALGSISVGHRPDTVALDPCLSEIPGSLLSGGLWLLLTLTWFSIGAAVITHDTSGMICRGFGTGFYQTFDGLHFYYPGLDDHVIYRQGHRDFHLDANRCNTLQNCVKVRAYSTYSDQDELLHFCRYL